MTRYTDESGLITESKYNWSLLRPCELKDANDNTTRVTYSSSGEIMTGSFWGTENGVRTGYSENVPVVPADITEAIKSVASLSVSQMFICDRNSWMRKVSPEFMTPEYSDIISRLKDNHLITEDGYFSAFSGEHINEENRCLIKAVMIPDKNRLPPHILQLKSDRYDNDKAQQVRQSIVFFDGFLRRLQESVRVTPGNANSRNDAGELDKHSDGALITENTDFRWAVTGRKEYNNKGYVIREYQPYFLNDWRYVSDNSARSDQWADTHYYDPLGRLIRVMTAKKYLRNNIYTPWFTVQEDENDTI